MKNNFDVSNKDSVFLVNDFVYWKIEQGRIYNGSQYIGD